MNLMPPEECLDGGTNLLVAKVAAAAGFQIGDQMYLVGRMDPEEIIRRIGDILNGMLCTGFLGTEILQQEVLVKEVRQHFFRTTDVQNVIVVL